MKTTPILLTAFLLVASLTSSFAATMGFAGTLDVQSVLVSDRKAVFIVSGSCELLLNKPSDSSGSAQDVTSALDHAVIVLYRTHKEFTEDAWHEACERYKTLSGKRAYFHTASPHYTWEGSDLTLISTEQFQIEAAKINE